MLEKKILVFSKTVFSPFFPSTSHPPQVSHSLPSLNKTPKTQHSAQHLSSEPWTKENSNLPTFSEDGPQPLRFKMSQLELILFLPNPDCFLKAPLSTWLLRQKHEMF